ncbi:MAG TPA: hypothetical protein VMS22_26610 [Candidatus Eisenbacteria bacterium]|nr:hypothetical protein [Candidatus Eisenbacteria bacterium]
MARPTERKHLVLLVALVATLVAQPLLASIGTETVELGTAAVFGIYVLVFSLLFSPGWERRGVLLLFVPAGIGRAILYALPDRLATPAVVAFHTMSIVFLGFAVVVILKDLFRSGQIRLDDVLGAVCGYILAALSWGHAYALTYWFVPTAFEIGTRVAAQLGTTAMRQTLFNYLSFTTLTSIGFNDIAPAGAPVYSLMWLETVFGQFYLAVVVAQLVGLRLAQSVRERRGHE